MSLLSPDEPKPALPFNPHGRAPALICCDHAGQAIPRSLGDLGVTRDELDRHIGWDIGALDVATRLAVLLDAPGIAAPYSRLVIDCNRGLTAKTLIPEESDGAVIPGNQALTEAQRVSRIDALWRPYHQALGSALARVRDLHPEAVLVSVHSFTPEMDGKARPWQIGVLWNQDQRLSAPLLAAFSGRGDLHVGDNHPYSGRNGFGYTVPHHAEAAGRPHVMLEIRQDEIDHAAGAARYAQLIADALAPVLTKFA
jgi:predicted N-formylglutamate amidohydrolase